MEIKTNLYNFSTAQNDFEKKLFEEIKQKEKQDNIKKIISNDKSFLNIIKDSEEACKANYNKKISELNNDAYNLFEKINIAEKRQNNINMLEDNYSVFDNVSKNESVIDEKKEFLRNEIDVLENKEKILLDEVIKLFNIFIFIYSNIKLVEFFIQFFPRTNKLIEKSFGKTGKYKITFLNIFIMDNIFKT